MKPFYAKDPVVCDRCKEPKDPKHFRKPGRPSRSEKALGGFWILQPCIACRGVTATDPEVYKERQTQLKNRYQTLRERVMKVYAQGDMSCRCCGYDDIRFLTIDHTEGDGAHIRRKGGDYWMQYLIHPDFTKLQILCYNCNCAKGTRKLCPHQEDKLLSNG